jgi:hypothetical protein
MPQVMECINGYRDGQVQLSIKKDGAAVPAGSLEYLQDYGYFKIANLTHQLDLSVEPFDTWIQRFLKTFLGFDLHHKNHISMLYSNENLTYSPSPEDIDIIHQCTGTANIWIKTHNKETHQVNLSSGDLLVVTPKAKVYRRKPNFFSYWADKFSTVETTYIHNIFQYGINLPNQMGA